MLQGVFYPGKYFGTGMINWPGYLYDYWFYNSQQINNTREDTVHDYMLQLDQDDVMSFLFDPQNGLTINRYSDPTGSGSAGSLVDNVHLDDLSPIWEAGKILFQTDPADRTIYTVNSSGQMVNFGSSGTPNITHRSEHFLTAG